MRSEALLSQKPSLVSRVRNAVTDSRRKSTAIRALNNPAASSYQKIESLRELIDLGENQLVEAYIAPLWAEPSLTLSSRVRLIEGLSCKRGNAFFPLYNVYREKLEHGVATEWKAVGERPSAGRGVLVDLCRSKNEGIVRLALSLIEQTSDLSLRSYYEMIFVDRVDSGKSLKEVVAPVRTRAYELFRSSLMRRNGEPAQLAKFLLESFEARELPAALSYFGHFLRQVEGAVVRELLGQNRIQEAEGLYGNSVDHALLFATHYVRQAVQGQDRYGWTEKVAKAIEKSPDYVWQNIVVELACSLFQQQKVELAQELLDGVGGDALYAEVAIESIIQALYDSPGIDAARKRDQVFGTAVLVIKNSPEPSAVLREMITRMSEMDANNDGSRGIVEDLGKADYLAFANLFAKPAGSVDQTIAGERLAQQAQVIVQDIFS